MRIEIVSGTELETETVCKRDGAIKNQTGRLAQRSRLRRCDLPLQSVHNLQLCRTNFHRLVQFTPSGVLLFPFTKANVAILSASGIRNAEKLLSHCVNCACCTLSKPTRDWWKWVRRAYWVHVDRDYQSGWCILDYAFGDTFSCIRNRR